MLSQKPSNFQTSTALKKSRIVQTPYGSQNKEYKILLNLHSGNDTTIFSIIS